jgi:hypothetical protein
MLSLRTFLGYRCYIFWSDGVMLPFNVECWWAGDKILLGSMNLSFWTQIQYIILVFLLLITYETLMFYTWNLFLWWSVGGYGPDRYPLLVVVWIWGNFVSMMSNGFRYSHIWYWYIFFSLIGMTHAMCPLDILIHWPLPSPSCLLQIVYTL